MYKPNVLYKKYFFQSELKTATHKMFGDSND